MDWSKLPHFEVAAARPVAVSATGGITGQCVHGAGVIDDELSPGGIGRARRAGVARRAVMRQGALGGHGGSMMVQLILIGLTAAMILIAWWLLVDED